MVTSRQMQTDTESETAVLVTSKQMRQTQSETAVLVTSRQMQTDTE